MRKGTKKKKKNAKHISPPLQTGKSVSMCLIEHPVVHFSFQWMHIFTPVDVRSQSGEYAFSVRWMRLFSPACSHSHSNSRVQSGGCAFSLCALSILVDLRFNKTEIAKILS